MESDDEVYVLCGSRSLDCALRFLSAFAPRRTPAAADYPFPEFSGEPEVVFDDPEDLIRRLETASGETYSIYWNVDPGGESDQAMLFFTHDGQMICGLGGPTGTSETVLSSLQRVVGGDYGYVSGGTCPPFCFGEFASICQDSTLPNLFQGALRVPGRTA